MTSNVSYFVLLLYVHFVCLGAKTDLQLLILLYFISFSGFTVNIAIYRSQAVVLTKCLPEKDSESHRAGIPNRPAPVKLREVPFLIWRMHNCSLPC